MEIIKILGEYTNRHFNPIGGFSARHSRDEILTIFPHTGTEEAKQLVFSFADEMKLKTLEIIQNLAADKIGIGNCFDVYLHAGITHVLPRDAINQIIDRARENQKVIATYRCDRGGDMQ
jgi:phospholipid/cholesterol/gamma-HCH transport system ATP-binding protein